MRITERQLRQIIRETLEGDTPDDTESEEGALSPENQWLGQIPSGILTTCSSRPIPAIRDTSSALSVDAKPSGLWYAPGREWIDWMRFERPEWLDRVNYVYRVVPSETVLKLQTVDQVRAFHNKYRSREGREIFWYTVADNYDGVEIIPYQVKLRVTDVRWYDRWDLESGCIWRPSGAAELELIATRPGV
jgi:hypothetical protein